MQALTPKLKLIQNLELELKTHEQLDVPVRHYFADGFYAREMTVPAGTLLTGKTHRSEHLCFITQGSARVASDEFTGEVTAPYTYVSKPGAKRAILALEDLVWTTVHLTSETDLLVLEDLLIEPEVDELPHCEEVT